MLTRFEDIFFNSSTCFLFWFDNNNYNDTGNGKEVVIIPYRSGEWNGPEWNVSGAGVHLEWHVNGTGMDMEL